MISFSGIILSAYLTRPPSILYNQPIVKFVRGDKYLSQVFQRAAGWCEAAGWTAKSPPPCERKVRRKPL
jgi:hypothetical protein